MSRGQTPRTPENFPRMNDRAGRRRERQCQRRAFQRFTRPTFVQEVIDALTAVADGIAKMFAPGRVAERIGRKLWADRQFGEQLKRIPWQYPVPRFAEGGTVQGPRPDDDSIPVMLSPAYHSVDGGQTWHEAGPADE